MVLALDPPQLSLSLFESLPKRGCAKGPNWLHPADSFAGYKLGMAGLLVVGRIGESPLLVEICAKEVLVR